MSSHQSSLTLRPQFLLVLLRMLVSVPVHIGAYPTRSDHSVVIGFQALACRCLTQLHSNCPRTADSHHPYSIQQVL